jgi:hypothetical protein
MRKIVCASVLFVGVLGASDTMRSAPRFPDFSGSWVLSDGDTGGSASWSPFGREELITQTADGITFVAGNRTTTYKLDGTQARWVSIALLIDAHGVIIVCTRTGANELKILQSYPTIEPGGTMATGLITYHRK